VEVMDYIHDSWCDLDKDGQCDCYVALLEARDKRITQLEECLKRINARAISIMADLSDDQPSWHDAQRINQLCDKALRGE